MKRRTFVSQLGKGALLPLAAGVPVSAFADSRNIEVTILHTNDVHSRIDPFPMDGGRNAGKGGAAKRASLIASIRSQKPNVLLFDSGDIFQGTPYFNVFEGGPEMEIMSMMGYDAATMGNHDFDLGVEGFNKQLGKAHFPFIVSNYDFSDTLLEAKIEPYRIFKRAGIKFGVIGLGIELQGLVPQSLYGNTQYQNPVEKGDYYAGILKNDYHCDYIICLSHLGYRYRDEKISDVILAAETKHIDLILGGHTHTFMKAPEVLKNKNGNPVLIHQAGWGGILLGQINLQFERNKKRVCLSCKNLIIN
jgi:5'-nucleotidase